MKKTTVKLLKSNQEASNISENPTEWLNEGIKNNYWGKPERWVRAKVIVPPDHDGGTGYFIYPDEQYNDEDVLETVTRTRSSDTETIEEDWVKLKAEYTIEIEDYIPPPPQSLTPRQARLVLNKYGLRDDVELAVESAGRDARDTWEYSNEIRRDWPLLNQMAISLGITNSQLDDMFREGSLL